MCAARAANDVLDRMSGQTWAAPDDRLSTRCTAMGAKHGLQGQVNTGCATRVAEHRLRRMGDFNTGSAS